MKFRNHLWHILVLGWLSLAGFAPAFGQVIFDESTSDISFFTWKFQLLQTVKARNLAQLNHFFADTVYESNDGCGWPGCSQEEFVRYYFAKESSVGNDYWAEMERIIRLGFFRSDYSDTFRNYFDDAWIAPSYLNLIDDNFELVVLGDGIKIYDQPSRNGKIIYKASNEKFGCDCNIETMTNLSYVYNAEGEWVQVALKDRRKGYVLVKYSSEGIRKEIHVSRIGNEWKITWFFHPPGC